MFIESKDREVAWCARVGVKELSKVKGLDGTRRETNVLDLEGFELVAQFELPQPRVFRIDESDAGGCDLTVFVVWVRCRGHLQHRLYRRVELAFQSVLLLFLSLVRNHLVPAVDYVRIAKILVLNVKCVRQLANHICTV